MPEIQFKGKEFVFNHHLSVPYRPLVPNEMKSIGGCNINDNLIVHGDNLHALKALMPMYAGKIDCVFIDPPYNTNPPNLRNAFIESAHPRRADHPAPRRPAHPPGKIYQSDQQIAPFNELASMSLQTARGYGWLEWLPNELKFSL